MYLRFSLTRYFRSGTQSYLLPNTSIEARNEKKRKERESYMCFSSIISKMKTPNAKISQ